MLHPAAIRSKMHFFKSSPHHYTLNNSWMNKCSSLMQYHKSLRLWSAYHRHTCSSGLTFAKCILPNRGITPHHAKAIYPGTLHRAGGWMLYVRHPNKPDNTRTDTDMHTHISSQTCTHTDRHEHTQRHTLHAHTRVSGQFGLKGPLNTKSPDTTHVNFGGTLLTFTDRSFKGK